MARIVLGLGSSHTPQLSTTTEWWQDHAERDRRNPFLVARDGEVHAFDEIAAVPEWRVGDGLLTEEAWTSYHARAQEAILTLGRELAAADPDVVLVVGDDQSEMFLDDGTPTFAVYHGDVVQDVPLSDEERARKPQGLLAAQWAVHSDGGETYEVPAALGTHVIEQMMLEEFDVTALSRQPGGRSIGHAFTFVRRRLMPERRFPMLPVLLNSYNPPNQPSPRRCHLFGRALRRAVESYPEDVRVAVVASGGLSHFVVNEELDRRVIDGLQRRDVESLTTIPRRHMRSGSSEILNWVAAGGALEHLTMNLVDYVPAYRSGAGTGVGMAFAVWR